MPEFKKSVGNPKYLLTREEDISHGFRKVTGKVINCPGSTFYSEII